MVEGDDIWMPSDRASTHAYQACINHVYVALDHSWMNITVLTSTLTAFENGGTALTIRSEERREGS